ncbi:MAG: 16S rRNA (cytidine(1402)-2'-O)-methyltransferase [Alphaproteobacteria bacterium]|nr:16S rRNA (cytidine(1402)-2'-O)-methyltransferase [Alphaproteobacteria bacterium]
MILKSGLYLVATPIGNLEDITLRALDVLKECDTIICEDSRVSRKLLSAYNIEKPLMVYHDHNAELMRPKVLEKLQAGEKMAFITDAGMPLISDPGYKLVKMCRENEVYMTVIPGASSVLAGIVLSGMPSDKFTFCGFAEPGKFEEFASYHSTLVFFESAPRLVKTLEKMGSIFLNRNVAVVREITKMFEETQTGSFLEMIDHFTKHPARGEIVLCLSPPASTEASEDKIDDLLKKALSEMSVKDASEMVAKILGLPKKKVYQRALELKSL